MATKPIPTKKRKPQAGGNRDRPHGSAPARGWSSLSNAESEVFRDLRPIDFVALYDTSVLDRVAMVRDGVAADMLTRLAATMEIPKEQLYDTLGVSRATVDRKIKQGGKLSTAESERALGLARLVGQVERMVRESGNPTGFDPAHWVAEWLERPNPALGGLQPGSLMDTTEGTALVATLVAQMQSGGYA